MFSRLASFAARAQARRASTQAEPHASALGHNLKVVAQSVGILATGSVAALAIGDFQPLHAVDPENVHPSPFPWSHHGLLASHDHSSIRRGYQVYRQVCAACHSLERIAYRNVVDVCHTEDEAKAIAEEAVIIDGPDETGKMFERPGKLSDYHPWIYANEEAARHANGGALPPDLSLIVKARHSGEDYVFSLLTGYCEPPAGVEIREGLHYNPYMPGQAIAMQAPLYSEQIEFEDGTPATLSQMAKDVVVFLSWCAEPELDERKRMGMKAMFILSMLTAGMWYYKRFKWSALKTRVVTYQPRKK